MPCRQTLAYVHLPLTARCKHRQFLKCLIRGERQKGRRNMLDYPDPERHLVDYVTRSMQRYVDGLQQAGLQPTETLLQALLQRTLEEAQADYLRKASQVHTHNIQVILSDHTRRMNDLKRSGARLRLQTCPLLALGFGLLAWYSLSQPGSASLIMGLCYAATALALLVILILGAIFDRPQS